MRQVLPWTYLILSVLGAILPWQANLSFLQSTSGSGFDLGRFIAEANATAAAQSLSRDLLIGASAIVVWLISEGRRLQIKGWPLSLVACFSISFACGAPLFLFLRERRLIEMEKSAKNCNGGSDC